MRVASGLGTAGQCGNAGLGTGEGAAHIDAEQQVKTLQGGGRGGRQADRAGIVDQYVDASEVLDRRAHRIGNGSAVADISRHSQRPTTRRLDLLRGAIEGSRQFRIRCHGLGRKYNLSTVARCTRCYRQPDAARGPGDEQRLALERSEREEVHRCVHPKRLKSGLRFWTNACRASSASGLRSRSEKIASSACMACAMAALEPARMSRLVSRTAPGGNAVKRPAMSCACASSSFAG